MLFINLWMPNLSNYFHIQNIWKASVETSSLLPPDSPHRAFLAWVGWISPAFLLARLSLTLAKRASSNMLQCSSRLTNCCQSALNNSAESFRFSEPPSYISCLFSSVNATKLQLSSLTLKDISVSTKDEYTLLEAIEIPNLRKTSLDNCGEALFDTTYNDIPFRRRTPPSQLFLDVLSKNLSHLESLNLNLSNELCYNRITFRAVSTLLPLKHLGIHIKVFKGDDAINLAPLVDSIQPHSNSLEYLNLCCDVVDSSVSVCPETNNRYSLKSVIGLSNLRKLKVLKLPLSFSQISDVANVLCPLTNLHIIQFGITDVPCSAPKTACDPCNNTAAYGLYSASCSYHKNTSIVPPPSSAMSSRTKHKNTLTSQRSLDPSSSCFSAFGLT